MKKITPIFVILTFLSLCITAYTFFFSWGLLPQEHFLESLKNNISDEYYVENLQKTALYYYTNKLEQISGQKVKVQYKDDEIGDIYRAGRDHTFYTMDGDYRTIPTLMFYGENSMLRYDALGKDGRVYKMNFMVWRSSGLEFNSAFSKKVLGKISENFFSTVNQGRNLRSLQYKEIPKKEIYKGYCPLPVVEYLYEYAKAYRLLARMSYDNVSKLTEQELKQAFADEEDWWRVYYPVLDSLELIKTTWLQNPYVLIFMGVTLILLMVSMLCHTFERYEIGDGPGKIRKSKVARILFFPVIYLDDRKNKKMYEKASRILLASAEPVWKELKDKESAQDQMDIMRNDTVKISAKENALQSLQDRLRLEQSPPKVSTASLNVRGGGESIQSIIRKTPKPARKQDPNDVQRRRILGKIESCGGSQSLNEEFLKKLGKARLDFLETIFTLLNGEKELKRAFLNLRPSRLSSYINSKSSKFYQAVEGNDINTMRKILLDS